MLVLTVMSLTKVIPQRARDALPQEIFRESVEPEKGGKVENFPIILIFDSDNHDGMTVTSLILKVPESAHMRIELNKIDSAGLDNAEALRFKDDNL